MAIQNEIQEIIMQAAEIKRLREMMTRELAEIERYHDMQCNQLRDKIVKLEIKIALSEIGNDEN